MGADAGVGGGESQTVSQGLLSGMFPGAVPTGMIETHKKRGLKIQAALFVPCSCPGGTTQKIPSYYFLSKNSLIWSFGTISDLKA